MREIERRGSTSYIQPSTLVYNHPPLSSFLSIHPPIPSFYVPREVLYKGALDITEEGLSNLHIYLNKLLHLLLYNHPPLSCIPSIHPSITLYLCP